MTRPRKQPEETVGLRAFAREVGVSHSAIQRAIAAGRLTAVETPAGRKLPKAQALAEWNASRVPGKNNRFGELPADGLDHDPDDCDQEAAASGPADLDLLPWTIRKVAEDALLAAERRRKIVLEREELEGRLHRDEDVEAVWADILVRFRARILSIPAKAAPIIATMAKPEPAKVQAALEAQIREALSELAAYDQAKVKAARRRRSAKS